MPPKKSSSQQTMFACGETVLDSFFQRGVVLTFQWNSSLAVLRQTVLRHPTVLYLKYWIFLPESLKTSMTDFTLPRQVYLYQGDGFLSGITCLIETAGVGKVLGVQERSLAMFLKCCCCCICFLVGFIIFFLIGDHDCCCLFFMLLQHLCRCCRCSCFRLCLCLLWWLLFLLLFLLFFLLLLFLFKLPFTKLCYYQSLSGDSPNLADRILPGGSQSLAPQIGNTGDRKKSMSLFFLHCTQWSPTKLACAVKKL